MGGGQLQDLAVPDVERAGRTALAEMRRRMEAYVDAL
jgi:CxxC motif-containing protein (DUF1111 family)